MDPVRVGPWNDKQADLRFRAEFAPWMSVLTIQHDAKVISMESILNLLMLAGCNVGVFEWRPECKGNHGLFEILPGGMEEVEKMKTRLGRYRKADITLENSGVLGILAENGLGDMFRTREAERAAKKSGGNGSAVVVTV